MNPNPADNQTDNNQPKNNSDSNSNLPQLENETPLDITIYPSNENPNVVMEPQKLQPESISTITNQAQPAPKNEELAPVRDIPSIELPPLPTQNVEITPKLSDNLNFGTPQVQNSPITQATPTEPLEIKSGPSSQKVAIILGGVLGVLLVIGGSVYFYTSNSTKQNQSSNTSLPTTTGTPSKPTMIQPAIQVLSLTQYQNKVDSIYTRYNNVVAQNLVDTSKNTLSVESIRFISDDIFSMSTEVNELELPENLKVYNSNLYLELQNLVKSYDGLLMGYKANNNTLNPELRNNFNISIKSSNDKLKVIVDEIKNLK